MKVLFFTSALPLPPFSGGQVRSLNLLKQISKEHEVTLFSFIRQESELNYLSELKKIVKEVKTFKRRKINSFNNLKYLVKYPFAAALYYDPEVTRKLKVELRQGYDLAHFESFYTFPFLEKDLGVKVVAGNQNVEYFIYQRYAATKKEPARSLMKFDIARMKTYEENKWKIADTSLAVSVSDQKVIEDVVSKDCPVIPNGIDIDFFKGVKRQPEDSLFLFVGPTNYIQNADSAIWLVKEIWPEIKRAVPNARLWFVGRAQQDWLLKLNNPDIKVQTDLNDIREAYCKATVMLAPLRAGSGTKFKVLEAFASSLPVITTKVGIEGLEARPREEFLLAETPAEFSLACAELLENSALNVKIVQGAKKLVEEKYSWEKIGRKLNSVYAKTA